VRSELSFRATIRDPWDHALNLELIVSSRRSSRRLGWRRTTWGGLSYASCVRLPSVAAAVRASTSIGLLIEAIRANRLRTDSRQSAYAGGRGRAKGKNIPLSPGVNESPSRPQGFGPALLFKPILLPFLTRPLATCSGSHLAIATARAAAPTPWHRGAAHSSSGGPPHVNSNPGCRERIGSASVTGEPFLGTHQT
jgi:hypothetical protein